MALDKLILIDADTEEPVEVVKAPNGNLYSIEGLSEEQIESAREAVFRNQAYHS